MNAVQPIRNKGTLDDIIDYLKEESERNYVLFCTGIYVPIRISDILELRVRDVRNKTNITLREKKTNKEFSVPINRTLRKIYQNYCVNKRDYEYLFMSRQRKKDDRYAPLSRQQAYNILKKVAKKFNIDKVGCHTMRKTFGYHYYKKTKDIETLRKIYNHHNTGITARYIGLTQSMIDDAINRFEY